tara:strand:- start:705 stop:1091 length:387 start_codon:yes stop_codon:yes gene_type:complete
VNARATAGPRSINSAGRDANPSSTLATRLSLSSKHETLLRAEESLPDLAGGFFDDLLPATGEKTKELVFRAPMVFFGTEIPPNNRLDSAGGIGTACVVAIPAPRARVWRDEHDEIEQTRTFLVGPKKV